MYLNFQRSVSHAFLTYQQLHNANVCSVQTPPGIASLRKPLSFYIVIHFIFHIIIQVVNNQATSPCSVFRANRFVYGFAIFTVFSYFFSVSLIFPRNSCLSFCHGVKSVKVSQCRRKTNILQQVEWVGKALSLNYMQTKMKKKKRNRTTQNVDKRWKKRVKEKATERKRRTRKKLLSVSSISRICIWWNTFVFATCATCATCATLI